MDRENIINMMKIIDDFAINVHKMNTLEAVEYMSMKDEIITQMTSLTETDIEAELVRRFEELEELRKFHEEEELLRRIENAILGDRTIDPSVFHISKEEESQLREEESQLRINELMKTLGVHEILEP